MNAADMRMLVREQLELIDDPVVREGLSRVLVSPRERTLAWEYGGGDETYPGWMVAEHPESDTGIAWCGHGFGPKMPWGLVSLTSDSMGMDCSWYPSLRVAFLESWAASDLEIWVVVQHGDWASERPLSEPTTSDVAFRRRDERPDARDCLVMPRRWPGRASSSAR